jgi:hypothetical protein
LFSHGNSTKPPDANLAITTAITQLLSRSSLVVPNGLEGCLTEITIALINKESTSAAATWLTLIVDGISLNHGFRGFVLASDQ